MTPSRNLSGRLSYSPCSSIESKSRSRSYVSSSSLSSSPIGTLTPSGLFARLKHQQSGSKNNITTYFAGELHMVEYPLNRAGICVKPSLVWSILKTYDMPQLYCFHEEKVYTHLVEQGLLYVVECGQKKGKCGYYVNFNLAYLNKNGPAKLYQLIQNAGAVMDSTEDGLARNELFTHESSCAADAISAPNTTSPSSGPLRTPKHRQASNLTAWITQRSIQRLKKAQTAEHVSSSHRELEPISPAAYTLANPALTSALAPTFQELMQCDYSQPPYTQEHPANQEYHIDLSYFIHEITLDLRSLQGFDKMQFWLYFHECEHCGYIARIDAHVCVTCEADKADGNGYEGDVESSPIHDGKSIVHDMEEPSD